MEYFLRFTDSAEEDLDRGFSLFKSGEKLAGLCGFRIADTDEEFENLDVKSRISIYQQNFGYSTQPVIFKGNMISRGPVEGDLFEPISIV